MVSSTLWHLKVHNGEQLNRAHRLRLETVLRCKFEAHCDIVHIASLKQVWEHPVAESAGAHPTVTDINLWHIDTGSLSQRGPCPSKLRELCRERDFQTTSLSSESQTHWVPKMTFYVSISAPYFINPRLNLKTLETMFAICMSTVNGDSVWEENGTEAPSIKSRRCDDVFARRTLV